MLVVTVFNEDFLFGLENRLGFQQGIEVLLGELDWASAALAGVSALKLQRHS